MKLQTKLSLMLSVLFLIFSLGIWHYSSTLIENINERWAQRLIEKQITFDKYRTLLPILREVTLAKQMAAEPALKNMALNDNDPEARQAGLKILEAYRLKFQNRNFFAAFPQTGHYYFNDDTKAPDNNLLAYTLDSAKKDDQWFFTALKLNKDYQINVNKDTVLNTTKVWIDFLLRDQGKVIAVIGTGLDLSPFLKESVDIPQEGIRNIFVNDLLAIQLDRDPSNISYSSFSTALGEQKSLAKIIDNPRDFQQIKTLTQQMRQSPEPAPVQTLWVNFGGEKHLVGIAYLKELDWFSLTAFDTSQFVLINPFYLFLTLIGLLLTTLVLFSTLNKLLVLRPIDQLIQHTNEIKQGRYGTDILVIGTGEIAELSKQFKVMAQAIKTQNDTLEQTVQERTNVLKENEQKLNTILDNIQAYIFIKDKNYRYIYANKFTLDLFGKPLEDVIGLDDWALFPEATAESFHVSDQRVIEKGEETRREEVTLDEQGEIIRAFSTVKAPLHHQDGTLYGLCGISMDITERKRQEREIEHLAFYDVLTQLPNRRLLSDRILQAQALSKRNNNYAALLFLDLDNFKTLNDNYGHDVGDLLLIEAAVRLKECVRVTDTVARFGGDEFVVLLSELNASYTDSITLGQILAEKTLASLSKPYHLKVGDNTITHQSSASIGVSLFKGMIYSSDQIINHADQAMYGAKKAGRNQIHLSPFSASS